MRKLSREFARFPSILTSQVNLAGERETRRQILLYTAFLIVCTLIPVVMGMSGLIYLGAALLLDARFLYLVLALQRGVRPDLPMRTFRFSITYLMALFGAFIADHCCRLL